MKTPDQIKAALWDALHHPERVVREMSATHVLDCYRLLHDEYTALLALAQPLLKEVK